MISAIGKADPEEIADSLSGISSAPAPAPATDPVAVVAPEKKPPADDNSLDPIDRLIADAPDHAVEPEPVKLNPDPDPAPLKPVEENKAEKDNTAKADEFHNDPLIVEALKVFKGRLIS